MDRVYVSKCETCGSKGRVFPDQQKEMMNNPHSPFRKYLPINFQGKSLPWICIACNSTSCRIIGYEQSEKAYKLMMIRERGSKTHKVEEQK